jgi:hypothetical protein
MLAGAGIFGLVALALATAVDAGPGAGARTPVPFSLTPPPPAGRGRPAAAAQFPLEPAAGGGYRYQGPRFVATIAADGVVSFVDRKRSAGGLQFALTPAPLPPGTPSLESSFREALGGRRRPKPTPADSPPDRAHPAAPIHDRDPGGRPLGYPNHMLPLVVADLHADVLAQYLSLMADDRAGEDKAQFLTATFDMRAQMAARAQAARVRGSRAQMQRLLSQVWSDASRPPIERRRLICALWAELDATSEAGAEGRAGLLAFVAKQLPAGSPQAFSAAEIAACPAAGDGARFRPSGGAPPGGRPAAGSPPPPRTR